MGDISSQKLSSLQGDLRPDLNIHNLGVDTTTYDWVKLFVKDRECREGIRQLQGQIAEIQNLPIDKDELKAALKENLAAFRSRRLAFLRGNIAQAQHHIRIGGIEGRVFGPDNAYHSFGAPVNWIPFLDFNLTEAEIDSIFEGLEQGVTRKEKDKQIAAVRQKIAECEGMIEKKLSPKERWFFGPDGERIIYPRGCRWTNFVSAWEEVASRYIGPVDIDGYKLKTAEEHAAYGLLKLGEIEKRTPLREGMKR